MFRKSRDEHSRTEAAFFRFISERVRDARRERSKSQQDLARSLYKTGKVISDIERGREQVSAVQLADLARRFQKPITFSPPRSRRTTRLRAGCSICSVCYLCTGKT